MIDWLTLRFHVTRISEDLLPRLSELGDRITRYNAKTGEIVWETAAWDSVRSDSHKIVCRMGADGFWIQGSPASVTGDGCNVFGSSDVQACARAMIQHVATQIDIPLPDVDEWGCVRMDITYNYLLPTLADVRQALGYLQQAEGGRYRVSQQSGSTVYWSHLSHLRSGKAYAKGPHVRKLLDKGDRNFELSSSDLNRVDRLLRLELSLKSQYWRERAMVPWQDYTAKDLSVLHHDYFDRMTGAITVPESELRLLDKLEQVTTKGIAKAAMRTWNLIRFMGYDAARESMSRPTWYRHRQILREAGLGDIDLATGVVTPLRRKAIVLDSPCESWEELRRCA